MMMAERFRQLLDGIGRVGVDFPVSGLVHPPRRLHHLRGAFELRHQAPDGRGGRLGPHACSSRTSAPGTMVRISKMEMTGMKRMNRKKSVKKRPRVPTYVDQSQKVGWYMPHDEGRKSRCRLVTTITKRSSHMPTLTNMATMNRPTTPVRTILIQMNWGATMLQTTSAAEQCQEGQNWRLWMA